MGFERVMAVRELFFLERHDGGLRRGAAGIERIPPSSNGGELRVMNGDCRARPFRKGGGGPLVARRGNSSTQGITLLRPGNTYTTLGPLCGVTRRRQRDGR